MSVLAVHRGTGFPTPERIPQQLAGEVSWLEAEVSATSTSGPALALAIDVSVPGWGGGRPVIVARLRDRGEYVWSPRPEWRDPAEALSVCAEVELDGDGALAGIGMALPYGAFPPGSAGGAREVEVCVHEAEGGLVAYGVFEVELPADLDRVPDLSSVLVHLLVSLVRVDDGQVDPDESETILRVLSADLALDELGEQVLRRTIKQASTVDHDFDLLIESLAWATEGEGGERLVNLLYACARADGVVQPMEQAFVDELLERLGIHDHEKLGSENLQPCYVELEVAPGTDLETVRASYHRLVRDYHPDRVAGLARGFRDFATQKTAALNDAWSQLEAELGAKRVPHGSSSGVDDADPDQVTDET